MTPLTNINVGEPTAIISPQKLKLGLPLSEKAGETVRRGRKEIIDILEGRDRRLLAIVGPCSIHEERSALEYAQRLSLLEAECRDRMLLVMRTYFEKPRTTIGWEGSIYDPHMDGSNDMNAGLSFARMIQLSVLQKGVLTATEFLDPYVPAYIDDPTCWVAIGARTTESATHRRMASGLSMPVGFKNGTDGSVQTAIDAMTSSKKPRSFLGINQQAQLVQLRTTGNKHGHIVLRGGNGHTNYDRGTLLDVSIRLKKAGLPKGILVDCSHANSGKNPENQHKVWDAVLEQFLLGDVGVMGMMLESHLFEGNQPIPTDLQGFDKSKLEYGVSVTDACIGWKETEEIIRKTHEVLINRRG